MKQLIISSLIALFAFVCSVNLGYAQPIPVELFGGNKHGTVTLVVNKKFTETSKFGFFHINIVQFDYINGTENDLMLQDMLFFEPIKNLRITGGAFYGGHAGFLPSVGSQFVFHKNAFFMLLAPRINIQQSPDYDIFSIFQFEPAISENMKLYTSLHTLNVFNKVGNIKSSQELRLGLDTKGFQFGVGINFEQSGLEFENSTNFGVFVKRDIF